ncbi:MAG: uroporphyrinogen-III C-methyltransferase [Candidatus Thermoplasmatota archaeon]|jgi:uroporphyrin-III C-methyltransferase|nr:uroporphyrinogen-III C-methyltransferase [Candidatus Thermoplasmatota archaeon]MCL5789605.1 uroporphyrinogen-III C-methyltransferase [Candidatus Thermoplasmatota archaeon]
MSRIIDSSSSVSPSKTKAGRDRGNGCNLTLDEKKRGKVFLVGAGPGDPELLTLKAVRTLEKADVVLYDRLVDRAILELIPKGREAVMVGTDHGVEPDSKQGEINRLMLNLSNEGKNVVRLKCGDPFIFGRGGEEVEFLKKEGIEFEIVPGLTSAISVPTAACVPLTHRDYSSSLMIISGHRKKDSGKEEVNDWNYIARFGGTLVILMGIGMLDEITRDLIEAGMDPEMGTIIIQDGTKKRQRIICGTVSNIASVAKREKISAPGIIVIGKVVEAIVGMKIVSPTPWKAQEGAVDLKDVDEVIGKLEYQQKVMQQWNSSQSC